MKGIIKGKILKKNEKNIEKLRQILEYFFTNDLVDDKEDFLQQFTTTVVNYTKGSFLAWAEQVKELVSRSYPIEGLGFAHKEPQRTEFFATLEDFIATSTILDEQLSKGTKHTLNQSIMHTVVEQITPFVRAEREQLTTFHHGGKPKPTSAAPPTALSSSSSPPCKKVQSSSSSPLSHTLPAAGRHATHHDPQGIRRKIQVDTLCERIGNILDGLSIRKNMILNKEDIIKIILREQGAEESLAGIEKHLEKDDPHGGNLLANAQHLRAFKVERSELDTGLARYFGLDGQYIPQKDRSQGKGMGMGGQ